MLRISVCMATFNGAAYLAEQLASIVQQLGIGDELLISDDASTDHTLEIVAAFTPPARLVGQSRAGGVVPNFERVLWAARGDVVMLCDQDDVWLPGRLDLVRRHLEDADLLMLNAKVVDAELRELGTTVFSAVGVRLGVRRNLLRNSFVGCCMALRRPVLTLALPFPRGLPWHDWYLGLIAEAWFRVRRLDEPTLLYRRHGANNSPTGESSSNTRMRQLRLRLTILYALTVAAVRRHFTYSA